uniref:WRKY domain-containing protein n=1 Tax=Panagrellus redivivus TaxID=6233 RepID=A0A7E4W3U3_PANRE
MLTLSPTEKERRLNLSSGPLEKFKDESFILIGTYNVKTVDLHAICLAKGVYCVGTYYTHRSYDRHYRCKSENCNYRVTSVQNSEQADVYEKDQHNHCVSVEQAPQQISESSTFIDEHFDTIATKSPYILNLVDRYDDSEPMIRELLIRGIRNAENNCRTCRWYGVERKYYHGGGFQVEFMSLHKKNRFALYQVKGIKHYDPNRDENANLDTDRSTNVAATLGDTSIHGLQNTTEDGPFANAVPPVNAMQTSDIQNVTPSLAPMEKNKIVNADKEETTDVTFADANPPLESQVPEKWKLVGRYNDFNTLDEVRQAKNVRCCRMEVKDGITETYYRCYSCNYKMWSRERDDKCVLYYSGEHNHPSEQQDVKPQISLPVDSVTSDAPNPPNASDGIQIIVNPTDPDTQIINGALANVKCTPFSCYSLSCLTQIAVEFELQLILDDYKRGQFSLQKNDCLMTFVITEAAITIIFREGCTNMPLSDAEIERRFKNMPSGPLPWPSGYTLIGNYDVTTDMNAICVTKGVTCIRSEYTLRAYERYYKCKNRTCTYRIYSFKTAERGALYEKYEHNHDKSGKRINVAPKTSVSVQRVDDLIDERVNEHFDRIVAQSRYKLKLLDQYTDKKPMLRVLRRRGISRAEWNCSTRMCENDVLRMMLSMLIRMEAWTEMSEFLLATQVLAIFKTLQQMGHLRVEIPAPVNKIQKRDNQNETLLADVTLAVDNPSLESHVPEKWKLVGRYNDFNALDEVRKANNVRCCRMEVKDGITEKYYRCYSCNYKMWSRERGDKCVLYYSGEHNHPFEQLDVKPEITFTSDSVTSSALNPPAAPKVVPIIVDPADPDTQIINGALANVKCAPFSCYSLSCLTQIAVEFGLHLILDDFNKGQFSLRKDDCLIKFIVSEMEIVIIFREGTDLEHHYTNMPSLSQLDADRERRLQALPLGPLSKPKGDGFILTDTYYDVSIVDLRAICLAKGVYCFGTYYTSTSYDRFYRCKDENCDYHVTSIQNSKRADVYERGQHSHGEPVQAPQKISTYDPKPIYKRFDRIVAQSPYKLELLGRYNDNKPMMNDLQMRGYRNPERNCKKRKRFGVERKYYYGGAYQVKFMSLGMDKRFSLYEVKGIKHNVLQIDHSFTDVAGALGDTSISNLQNTTADGPFARWLESIENEENDAINDHTDESMDGAVPVNGNETNDIKDVTLAVDNPSLELHIPEKWKLMGRYNDFTTLDEIRKAKNVRCCRMEVKDGITEKYYRCYSCNFKMWSRQRGDKCVLYYSGQHNHPFERLDMKPEISLTTDSVTSNVLNPPLSQKIIVDPADPDTQIINGALAEVKCIPFSCYSLSCLTQIAVELGLHLILDDFNRGQFSLRKCDSLIKYVITETAITIIFREGIDLEHSESRALMDWGHFLTVIRLKCINFFNN